MMLAVPGKQSEYDSSLCSEVFSLITETFMKMYVVFSRTRWSKIRYEPSPKLFPIFLFQPNFPILSFSQPYFEITLFSYHYLKYQMRHQKLCAHHNVHVPWQYLLELPSHRLLCNQHIHNNRLLTHSATNRKIDQVSIWKKLI